MPAPDLPDFAASVSAIEQVTGPLLPGNTIATANPPALIDTSRYSSLAILLAIPGGGDNKMCGLVAEWQDNGTAVDYDLITFHNASPVQPYPDWHQFHLPVRGQSLQLRLYDEVGNKTTSCVVYGSTRAFPGGRDRIARLNWGQVLLDVNTGAVAAGAVSGTFYIPPVARSLSLNTSANVVTTPYLLTVSGVGAIGSALSSTRLFVDAFTGRSNTIDLPVVGVGCTLTVTNNDTVSRNFNIRAWDAS